MISAWRRSSSLLNGQHHSLVHRKEGGSHSRGDRKRRRHSSQALGGDPRRRPHEALVKGHTLLPEEGVDLLRAGAALGAAVGKRLHDEANLGQADGLDLRREVEGRVGGLGGGQAAGAGQGHLGQRDGRVGEVGHDRVPDGGVEDGIVAHVDVVAGEGPVVLDDFLDGEGPRFVLASLAL